MWVLISKLGQTYDRKLVLMMNEVESFRELPPWRKEFKVAWKKAMKTPIMMPLNRKYRPNPHCFVCSCPQLVNQPLSRLHASLLPIRRSFPYKLWETELHHSELIPSLILIDEVRVGRAIEPIHVPTEIQACRITDGGDDESEDEVDEGENDR